MKIEWLDDALTEACLTRGWWRKQYAIVKLTPMKHVSGNYWAFAPSGDEVPLDLARKIDRDRDFADWRRRSERFHANWKPVEPLAVAKVVRRG